MSAPKWYHLHQTSVVTYDQLKLWVLKYDTGFIKNSKYGIKEKKKPTAALCISRKQRLHRKSIYHPQALKKPLQLFRKLI